MSISKNKIFSNIIIVLIILQLYVADYKISYIIQLICALIFLITEKKHIYKKIYIKMLFPLILIFIFGFIGTSINNYKLLDIAKDSLFFTKPVISFFLSYCIFKAINNKKYFFDTVINAGIICALIHLFIVIFIANHNSIHEIRAFTKDNFVELFSFFFLINYQRENNIPFSYPFKLKFIYSILILSILLYFSRMMFIIGFILILAHFGLTRLNKINIYILSIFVLLVISLFSILNSMNIKRDGEGVEAFLYKIKIAPYEILNTKIDINNKAQLWDHWRGYELQRALALIEKNPESKLIGNGFGSLIDLKFYAPIGNDQKGMKYISHTHNGYIFIYYKTGVLGVLLYFYFLFQLYIIGQIKNNFFAKCISAIALFYFFTTLTITGIYNLGENIILILGGLIFYFTPPLKHKFKTNE